jgi:endonuclease/exonuclease/phosphatase family metal-dependent hydrolase
MGRGENFFNKGNTRSKMERSENTTTLSSSESDSSEEDPGDFETESATSSSPTPSSNSDTYGPEVSWDKEEIQWEPTPKSYFRVGTFNTQRKLFLPSQRALLAARLHNADIDCLGVQEIMCPNVEERHGAYLLITGNPTGHTFALGAYINVGKHNAKVSREMSVASSRLMLLHYEDFQTRFSILVLHRPHKGSAKGTREHFAADLEAALNQAYHSLVILGDFNHAPTMQTLLTGKNVVHESFREYLPKSETPYGDVWQRMAEHKLQVLNFRRPFAHDPNSTMPKTHTWSSSDLTLSQTIDFIVASEDLASSHRSTRVTPPLLRPSDHQVVTVDIRPPKVRRQRPARPPISQFAGEVQQLSRRATLDTSGQGIPKRMARRCLRIARDIATAHKDLSKTDTPGQRTKLQNQLHGLYRRQKQILKDAQKNFWQTLGSNIRRAVEHQRYHQVWTLINKALRRKKSWLQLSTEAFEEAIVQSTKYTMQSCG